MWSECVSCRNPGDETILRHSKRKREAEWEWKASLGEFGASAVFRSRFLPLLLALFPSTSHGLRRGLHSFAASRLGTGLRPALPCRAFTCHMAPLRGWTWQNSRYSDAAKDTWASSGGSRSRTACLSLSLSLLWALRLASQSLRCLRAAGVSLEKKSPARP